MADELEEQEQEQGKDSGGADRDKKETTRSKIALIKYSMPHVAALYRPKA